MWGWMPSCMHLLDAELGGLGLLLAQGGRLQDVGQGDEATAARPFLVGQLAHRLDVVGVLQVADRAADLDEDHVGLGAGGQLAQPQLHLAGHVRDHLHVPAEVIAVALLVEDGVEDLAAGGEIGFAQVLVEHALVGAQVHVGFHAVVEDEDLAVAEGVERAGVDVEVAFQLDRRNLEALVLQELSQAGGEDPLAQAAHDRAHHEHVAGLALLVVRRDRREELALRRSITERSQQVVISLHININP